MTKTPGFPARGVVGAVTLAAAIALRAQDAPAPIFRGGIDVVRVDVSVLDKNRKPVRGLTAADFTVLEDGRPRPIVAFAPVDLPGAPAVAATSAGTAPWLREVPLDVATNRVAAEGRLITIVFDWSIRFADQPLARRIARAAVDNMGSQDLAAVVFTSGFANAGTSRSFTSDRARLLEAIDRPMTLAREGIDAERSAMTSLPEDRQPHPWLFDPDGEKSADCLCRVCVFDKVGEAADAVAAIPGRRKSMLFIGTYFPAASPNPASPCSDHVRSARDRATRKLNLANVTIHVVDPAGTIGADDGPVPGDAEAARAAGWRHVEDPGGLLPLTETSRRSRLPFLADMTGGRVVTNDNGADREVPAILNETSSYYVLAFESTDQDAANGRTHGVEVRVARHDVDLQFRRSYQAGQTAAALEVEARKVPLVRALEATLPRTDQMLALNVAPFALPGRDEAVVAVVLRTDPPAVTAPAAIVAGDVPRRDDASVVVAAVDVQGRIVGTVTQSASIPWAPGESAPAPYELLSRMALKPGRYEIRAASDLSSGQRSSVYGVVEVPDFGSERLSLSGIVVQALPPSGVSGSKDTFTAGTFASIPLPVVPTARRTFAAADRVTAFLRVYRNRTDGAAAVVTAEIVDAGGAVAFSDTLDADGNGYLLDLPLERLAPGEYLLRISATAGEDKASRGVRFTVRD